MWSFLTNTVCHKDVFSKSIEEVTSPNYLKCNPPSDDYTRNGIGKGGDGDSGWMFIRLTELILKLQPESFLITISDNVYNIHDGVQGTRGKKVGGSKGLVSTVANFLATESAQCSGDWHHRVRLVETL